ncbi:MAG TPA: DNA polymerase III subunit gamma/tau [Acidiferrobacterales bacterium]|nr:DNA polymerase III subunit gamma/tau [Acidiferrobacterales bacterium]
MSYQVLARKWRPRRFADLVGQTHVSRALINGLDHDRLHHAFLFTGTRGVGKTTIARILAKSLNCEAGVSSQPCDNCQSCREVDEGRFVDLIEVDAASRTKVDDTRELLDNVQYAPTRGRYKVYLIDEVHMLSGHSFNALLKTLEEPPPHVKFLLATTDPQKLPVTVLSRCLQFHLKRLSPEQISAQLEKILGAEGIAFDAASLKLLARSADGSMRDALSLLDQAIAFGGGKVNEPEVREMLGSIDNSVIEAILEGLAQADAPGLLAAISVAGDHNADPESVLGELLLALHRLALLQAAPEAEIDADHADVLRGYASRVTPEDVQLFYQIGLHGRRDIALAPDARSGLEMTLLRMLAFRPAAQPAGTRATGSAPAARPATSPAPAAAAVVSIPAPGSAAASGDSWSETVTKLGLTGLTRELANHCTLDAHEGGVLRLTLDQASVHLLNKEREAVFKQALARHYGRPLDLRIVPGSPQAETPAHERLRTQTERQQAAVEVIMTDPAVQALQENFGAKVDAGSIRPKN